MPYQVRDQALHVKGFTELNRALERINGGRGNFGIEYEMQKRLRTIGETIAKDAPQYVTHKTGRHGDPAAPRLEDSVGVSVTARSASVFSRSVYGGAQNVGAGPKAGWSARGPHIRRSQASGWMIKAVAANREFVAAEWDGLGDWLIEEFDRG